MDSASLGEVDITLLRFRKTLIPREHYLRLAGLQDNFPLYDDDLYAEPLNGVSLLDAELRWYGSCPVLHVLACHAFNRRTVNPPVVAIKRWYFNVGVQCRSASMRGEESFYRMFSVTLPSNIPGRPSPSSLLDPEPSEVQDLSSSAPDMNDILTRTPTKDTGLPLPDESDGKEPHDGGLC